MPMKEIIYADNAATTQLDIDAYNAMLEILQNEYGNPSQPYSFSRKSKKLIAEAREIIATCINASPDEIYFTSGGTESDNWALKGIALNNLNKSIITSQIEHHAILRSCNYLERLGIPITYLPTTEEGIIKPQVLENQINYNTSLVSIMLANNEVGSIQPIRELSDIAHSVGSLFHTDAVQAVGHIDVDVNELGVDFMSASAHKFNGPKGIGFLYIKNGVNIASFLHGGSQEFSLRAGTENVASIVGMAAALNNNYKKLSSNQSHILSLEKELLDTLAKLGIVEGQEYIINGSKDMHLPGNMSLSFKDNDGERILHRLDLMGIMVSTGAACNSINTQVSHVLNALSIPIDYAKGTIRISLGKNNTIDEAQKIAESISHILNV